MFERLFPLHSFVLTFLHFSVIHSVVVVHGAGDIRLLFKFLLKFRNVLKHTERRSSLACNQNIKDDIPTALEVFLCFETKRNDRNSPRKHSRNARVISAEELGTTSKNNLRGITLDIGRILGIHSLTLIISWLKSNKAKLELQPQILRSSMIMCGKAVGRTILNC